LDEKPAENLADTVEEAKPGSAGARAAPLQATFAGERYRILRQLGKGGQKLVYLARDMRLERDVVLSVMKTDQLDEQSIARLRREARAMAQLGDHPNIVTLYDFGEDDGRPYLVSQYVDGGALSDLLKRSDGNRLAIPRAIELARQLCAALTHAHGRGTIHRDVKPGNVWLTREGVAKLGDFGLALRLGITRLTLEGMLVGTVMYMSPEQALGQPVDPRTDLYSLGAMLYEMVAGRPPFLGDHMVAIVTQHVSSTPVAPSWYNPEIPAPLETLILRLLAKSPMERPESAAAVSQELASVPAALASPQPALARDSKSLSRLAAGIFVGRDQEMLELRAALNDARAGHGRLVLLVGEPGSGKTRTAEQLITYARMRDVQVYLGSCYEGEGAPAFWPWVQILRPYVETSDSTTLRSLVGTGAGALAQVVSEIRQRLPNLEPLPELEPKQARFRLFDSVTTFLKNAARSQPLLLILDDLHWADEGSLRLLEFLARELRDAQILVVATYRDVALGRQHPLAQTLAELARQGLSSRIVLRGLAEKDVERFIEMTAGLAPPGRLVTAVYKETEGNPFFVNEVVRLLVAEGRLRDAGESSSWTIRIPEGVREVIGRRLNRLSEPCNRVLTLASVIGREFSTDRLLPLSEVSEDRLFELLEEAIAARVIYEMPRTAGRYSFSHGLVRETLYGELSAGRRVRLHRRIGEALETACAGNPGPHLAELAYHFFEAAPGGNPDKAIDYAVRAGRRAIDLLAYEEAALHHEHALEALDHNEVPDERVRCDLLLALGDARKRAGDGVRSKEVFQRAAAQAKTLAEPDRQALAALGYGGGVSGAIGRVDEVEISLLREALEALPTQDSVLRARLLAHLSGALYYSTDQRVALSREAVEMARRLGDPAALLPALYFRHVALVVTEDLRERLAVGEEMLAIAERAGNKELVLRAWYRLILDWTELGEMAEVDRAIEVYARLARELRQPAYLWMTPHFRASRALLEGRLAEGERLAGESLAIGQKAQEPNALLFYGVHMNIVRLNQGRIVELMEATKQQLERYPMIPGNRAVLAYIYVHMHRGDEARALLDTLAANEFRDLGWDGSYIMVLSSLAYVVNFLEDAHRARLLYERLLPFRGRMIVSGNSAIGFGSVGRPLGLLAATMSRWDEAVGHFEEAVATNARLNARPFLAGVLREYARALIARGGPGDPEYAARLVERAGKEEEAMRGGRDRPSSEERTGG